MFYAGRSYHLAAKGSRYLQRAMQVLVTGMIFFIPAFSYRLEPVLFGTDKKINILQQGSRFHLDVRLPKSAHPLLCLQAALVAACFLIKTKPFVKTMQSVCTLLRQTDST